MSLLTINTLCPPTIIYRASNLNHVKGMEGRGLFFPGLTAWLSQISYNADSEVHFITNIPSSKSIMAAIARQILVIASRASKHYQQLTACS